MAPAMRCKRPANPTFCCLPWRLLILWYAIWAKTYVSQACRSTPFNLAVSKAE